MEKKKVVIIGGGFAGIYAARALARAARGTLHITLINRTNHFLFTPMLHEVATGGLGHHQVVESIREVLYKTGITFREATVEAVDISTKQVQLQNSTIAYDLLVFAQGSTSHFFNTPGAQQHALVLKDLHDAIAMRNRIIEMFERASTEPDPVRRAELLSFVIVGGGATGVEIAAEIAEFARRTLSKYYSSSCKNSRPTVTLVQSASELIPQFHPLIRARALKILTKNRITVRFSTRVTEVRSNEIILDSDEHVPAGTVIWTAGVKANTITTVGTPLPLHDSGRIQTTASLQVVGHSDMFAIGDAAFVETHDGRGVPMLAQVAISQADVLAKNILRILAEKPLVAFHYVPKGELVSLGRWEAGGVIFGIPVYGKLAWFIWRTVYLFKFISGSKRLRIAFDWTLQLFYPRDITRA